MSENPDHSGDVLVNFRIPKKLWFDFSRIIFERYGHGGIKKVFYNYINDYIIKFDGKLHKLDNFFDTNFTPKPNIDDDTEHKIIPWLRTMTTEQLAKQMPIFYQAYIWTRALHETPPNNRATANFDLTTLWKRYM